MFVSSLVRATVAALALTTLVSADQTHPSPDRPRDPAFNSCDQDPSQNQLDKQGVGLHWHTSDDPNFYTLPGLSACGYNYTDYSNVVCVNPGWIHSAQVEHCNAWVQVYLPESGVVTQGIVWDACGAVPNSTFDCNDMYLSKQMFEQLAGKTKNESIAAGRLPGQVQWRFIDMPCWGCYAGLPGIAPNGTADTCQGLDSMGFLRCGNQTDGNRITGAAAGYVCNQDIADCGQAASIAAGLPKSKSTAQTVFNEPTPTKRRLAAKK